MKAPMNEIVSLPFGIRIALDPHGPAARVIESNLEREFYLPSDDIGSKSEAARIAVEFLLAALAAANVDLQAEPSRKAIRLAVEQIFRRL